MSDHLLQAEAQDDPLLARVAVGVAAVTAREGADVFHGALRVVVEGHLSLERGPAQRLFEAEADPAGRGEAIGPSPVLAWCSSRSRSDHQGRGQTTPGLARRAVLGDHGDHRITQLRPVAQIICQDGANGQIGVGQGWSPSGCRTDARATGTGRRLCSVLQSTLARNDHR